MEFDEFQVCSISPDNSRFAIGGIRGTVRVYKFVSIKEEFTIESNGSQKVTKRTPIKKEVKHEIKQEVKDDVIVLD